VLESGVEPPYAAIRHSIADGIQPVIHLERRDGHFYVPVANSIRCNYNSCASCQMIDRVSTMDVRQRLGDMLNRVALRHDEFIIERKGKPLAALVPVERLEQMRRFARRHALEFMDQQQSSALSERQTEELAAEAKRWARSHASRSRRKTR
jgi:prevent-host-death family protein